MLGAKGIGRVGYDKKELDAMEKDVERVEKGEESPTKTPAKISGKGKGKEREVRKSASMKEVEDVIFAEGGVGDVSVGSVYEVEAGWPCKSLQKLTLWGEQECIHCTI